LRTVDGMAPIPEVARAIDRVLERGHPAAKKAATRASKKRAGETAKRAAGKPAAEPKVRRPKAPGSKHRPAATAGKGTKSGGKSRARTVRRRKAVVRKKRANRG